MATKRKTKKSGMKTSRIVVGALMGTAIVGGVIYARKRKEEGLPLLPFREANLPPAPNWPTPIPSSKPNYLPNTFPLSQWMQGAYVRQLQQALTAKGQRIAIDGYWGPQTQRAVEALGIPTPISQSALQAFIGGNSALPVSSNAASLTPDSASSSVSESTKNLAISAAVSGEVENAYFKSRPYAFAQKMTKVFTEPILRKTEITRIQSGDYIGRHLGKSIDMTVNGTKVRFARVRLRADKFPNKEGWVWSGTIDSRTSGPGTSGLDGVVVTSPTFIKDKLNRQIEVLPNTLLGEAMGVQNGMVKVRAKDGSDWVVSVADVMIT